MFTESPARSESLGHPGAAATVSDAARRVGPIAYVAGQFPAFSETFVYREVRGLRQRGWNITPVSLHEPVARIEGGEDLREQRIVVYGPDRRLTLGAAGRELINRPIRSLRTLSLALWDAAFPGESTPWRDRVKLPVQAIWAIGLAGRLRPAKVRHIHCHFAHAPTTLGMYAANQLRISFSFTGHANDLFQRRTLVRTKLRRSAFVSCISRWHREWYQSIEPAPAAKYHVIRCGVDVESWRPGPLTHGESATSNFRVITICRLVEKKGVDVVIRAVDELNRRGMATELKIVGDGPWMPRLQALAAELKCGDWLKWLGAVDNRTVPALLAQADVLTLPCRSDAQGDRDGIPVVLLEAMACGVPVISGKLPAIQELIEDGVGGMLVDGNDVPGLVDRLIRMAADPALRQRLAEGGRQRVIEEFSLERNLDRLEQSLSEIPREK